MNNKHQKRQKRAVRIRAKIQGDKMRPRISVFKSASHIYGQAIDDLSGKTVASVNDVKSFKASKDVPAELKGKEKNAWTVGQLLGQKLLALKLNNAVFDKGGFKYHGRVKALAEGLRHSGLKI